MRPFHFIGGPTPMSKGRPIPELRPFWSILGDLGGLVDIIFPESSWFVPAKNFFGSYFTTPGASTNMPPNQVGNPRYVVPSLTWAQSLSPHLPLGQSAHHPTSDPARKSRVFRMPIGSMETCISIPTFGSLWQMWVNMTYMDGIMGVGNTHVCCRCSITMWNFIGMIHLIILSTFTRTPNLNTTKIFYMDHPKDHSLFGLGLPGYTSTYSKLNFCHHLVSSNTTPGIDCMKPSQTYITIMKGSPSN